MTPGEVSYSALEIGGPEDHNHIHAQTLARFPSLGIGLFCARSMKRAILSELSGVLSLERDRAQG
jgi:hypothetical protein